MSNTAAQWDGGYPGDRDEACWPARSPDRFVVAVACADAAHAFAQRSAGARHLRAAHQHQYHGLERQHHGRGQRHVEAAHRCRVSRGGCPRDWAGGFEESQPRRALSWDRIAKTDPPAGPYRCRRSQAGRLVARSVHVHRTGWLLLRPRHDGHQGRCRDPRRHPRPAQTGRLSPQPRPDSRADHGGRRRQRLQWRRMAAREPSRPDRRGVRDQHGRRGSGHPERQAIDAHRAGERKGLRHLQARSAQSRWPQLAGGHAENALPQSASATVNCRMLPGTRSDDVQRALTEAVHDSAVAISVVSAAVPSPPSPLKPEIMDPIERVTKRLWNIPVVPVMETGATDGLYFRNAGIPVYGVSGVFVDINDIRAHGRDERIGVQDYYDGAEYIYQLVKAVSSRGGN